MTKQLSRRSMLRGAGGLAIGLPVLDAMFSLGGKLEGTAHAGTNPDGTPRRLIVFLTGFGYHPSTWITGQGRNFELSRMFAPFEPVKDRCLFLEGSDNRSTIGRLNVHPGGVTSVLTGSYSSSDDPNAKGGRVKAPISNSIDVRIDEALEGQVPFPSYRWATRAVVSKYSDCPFYSHDQRALRLPIANGSTSFAELFADVDVDGEMSDELVYRVESRERIFDLVRDDFDDLNKKLNADDRCRLEQHLESVQRMMNATGLEGGAGCQIPGEANVGWNRDENMPAIWRAQAEQIAMSLSCNAVRAAFASYGHLVNNDNQIYYNRFLDDQPGILEPGRQLPNRHHHQMSHDGNGYLWTLEKITHWHAMEVMHLVDLLQQIPDGDGTLFDHTAIVWMNEMGWDHGVRDTHQIIIGDGGGYFDGGQAINFSGTDADAHNRLLLNMLHYLGIEDETFGLERLCENGPFTEILA